VFRTATEHGGQAMGRDLMSLRPGSRRARARWACALVLGAVAAVAFAASSARADDESMIQAVTNAQLLELKQEYALNLCLQASPTKNTPCIRREARKLAALDGRLITTISAAFDRRETPCVRTVAQLEISYLTLWKAGATALSRDQRKKARQLFLKSAPIAAQQDQIEKPCFASVTGATGP